MGSVDWDEVAVVTARREREAKEIEETNSPAGRARLKAEMDAKMDEARRKVDAEFGEGFDAMAEFALKNREAEVNAAIVNKQLEECRKEKPVPSLADRVLEWNGMAVQSSGPVSDALLEACEVIDELRRNMDLQKASVESLKGRFSALAYNVQLARDGFDRACELAGKQ